MSERIEISPATVAQVHRSRKGVRVAVDDDVQNVARDLRELRSTLVLEFDPVEEFYIVLDRVTLADGSTEDRLVTTATECDQRLVSRVRYISGDGYDYAAELDRVEAQAERDRAHEFREQVGDPAERLAHALCKDLGLTGSRAVVPRGV